SSPPMWIPTHIEWANFRDVWIQADLARYFIASIIVALGATVLNTLLCVPAAYAVARLRFPGRKFAMYLLLMIEMFSPVIVIISLFKVIAQFHMLDTFGALIILDALFTVAFNTWMMNGYFKTIPKDIEEAALIDGCNRVQTMTRIMLPIAVPGLVTVMIYAFIFAWNEFLFALTLMSSKNKMPLTIALYNFVGQYNTQWQYLTMAAFLALIPVLVLFYLIEKRLVAGLAGGAVKG
ncbi:MAG TPA: carbohydrate ABC transporter permease, partial [Spirochaetia bacterium]|nr:carbohydrate ABC transporter permease [Spirochaetia bacterium]